LYASFRQIDMLRCQYEMFVASSVATTVFHVHLLRDFGSDCCKVFTVWQIRITRVVINALHCLPLQDVAYKPEELFFETRKCEPDAGADVVQSCER
jgi:hypothetical protein